MKDFLYLDTDYLESYLSQINDGKILNEVIGIIDGNMANEEEATPTHQFVTEAEGEAKLGIGVAGAKVQGKMGYSRTSPYSAVQFSEFEIGKNIITKALHDNAYLQLLDYAEKGKLISDTMEVGKFTYLTTSLNIMDFEYYEKLCSNEVIARNIPSEKGKVAEEIKNFKSLLKNAKNPDKALLEKQVRDLEKKKNETLEIKDLMSALSCLSPYTTFLVTPEAAVPLKPQYLREKARQVLFKYGASSDSTIHIFGKVTSTFCFCKDDPDREFFDVIKNAMSNMVYGLIFPDQEALRESKYIISPIAIYFE